jgi:ketosteroid isomerase-like protein
MNQKTIERELVELENEYWQAIQNRDIDGALRLTDDPCLVAGASGIAKVDRKAFTGIMERAKYRLESFELKDVHARMLGEDVAVLVYKVHEDLTVDGEAISIDCADASTWVRRNGKWVCAVHTEALAGDPYGRDRTHATNN